MVEDLKSDDRAVRLRAVRLLKEAAYPEAAVPLSALLAAVDDEMQLEVIAAEVNTFQIEKVVPRKRVGLVLEVRKKIAADETFSQGQFAIGPNEVPLAVLGALRRAALEAHPRVAEEAVYAFGTLAVEPSGARRRTLLTASGPDFVMLLAAQVPELRFGALRVVGRVLEHRVEDEPIDPAVGDAVIAALNDGDRRIRIVAMQALGAMRYAAATAALTEQFRYFTRGEVAEPALEALARIAHPSSAPLFATQLGVKQAPLKAFAIEGFARLGDASRLASIEKALAGERDDRGLLAATFARVVLADAPLDSLIEALRKPKVALQARQYLVEAVTGRASEFARYAQDPDVTIRSTVADVLGIAGDPAALAIVEPMRRDRDPQVAVAAARAFARLSALQTAP